MDSILRVEDNRSIREFNTYLPN